ncbi:MAG: hypothetical protein JWN03_8344 [Nocardia sp.]|uniref:hypothetical protein n=1 Tax=Nocardia sp. TaxID=1821 RepID=UPI002633873E|nr:hypothetical protein [Nocardia sp.]MCU1648069.1 hypothetical protein [Nocardia sp.]
MPPFTRHRALAVLGTVLIAAGTCLAAGCSTRSAGNDGGSGSTATSHQPQAGDATGGQDTVAADKAGIPWAPAGSATITPGIQTYTQGAGQCTANYVFVDGAGTVYLGQAAHCASSGQADQTNGCAAASLATGTSVDFNRDGSPISNGTTIGTGQLVYSSWLTMQQNGETDKNTCAYNDLALVRIAAENVGQVNPSLPYWGGPAGIDTTGLLLGGAVYSYGNSSLRGGFAGLSPQSGQSKPDDSATGGWTHAVISPTPGIPGDSGSAYLDRTGNALGTLSTLGISIPAINNIGDISHELAYARAHSGISGLTLVLGTESFTANR